MTTLVAVGDSFIWGSELADSPNGSPDGYSRNTFTALLAEKDYICAAYPGIGNTEIVRRTKEVCKQNSIDTVIVSWTWPSRDNELNCDRQILELQEFLEDHQIPYLFTCVDNCIITNNPKIKWENWYLFPPGINPNETTTPRGFYQWAVENKYSVGSDGHPLESAHQDAVELIKEKFNELVKKSIQ
jgi:hypothetical protein